MEIRILDGAVEGFIKGLQKPTIAKVLRAVDLLEVFGPKLGMPHVKKSLPRFFSLESRVIRKSESYTVFTNLRFFFYTVLLKNLIKFLEKKLKLRWKNKNCLTRYNIYVI